MLIEVYSSALWLQSSIMPQKPFSSSHHWSLFRPCYHLTRSKSSKSDYNTTNSLCVTALPLFIVPSFSHIGLLQFTHTVLQSLIISHQCASCSPSLCVQLYPPPDPTQPHPTPISPTLQATHLSYEFDVEINLKLELLDLFPQQTQLKISNIQLFIHLQHYTYYLRK
jgi:hypothetical protein